MLTRIKGVLTRALAKAEELSHSPRFNIGVGLVFALFAGAGYQMGGEAFLTEWVGGVAAAIGIACLIFKTQGYWFWSIVNALLWGWLYISWGLTMTAGLQAMYVIMSLYGLTMWATTHNRIGFDKSRWLDALGGVIGFAILAYVVIAMSGVVTLPYLSGSASTFTFLTAWWWVEFSAVFISICAFMMDAFKYRTNWIGWTMTNLLFGPMFWHLGLMGPFLLTFVFQTLCIIGIYKWWKDQREAVEAGEVELVGGAQYA